MLGLTRPLYVEGYFSMLSIRECLGDMTNGALHCCDRCHERKTVRTHLMLIIQTIMVWLSKMGSCGLFQYLSVWFWTIWPRLLRFLVGASRRFFLMYRKASQKHHHACSDTNLLKTGLGNRSIVMDIPHWLLKLLDRNGWQQKIARTFDFTWVNPPYDLCVTLWGVVIFKNRH